MMTPRSRLTRDGVRQVLVAFERADIDMLRADWRQFVDELPLYDGKFKGRGIVICAGGYGYFTCCWILIQTLRHENKCTLPIEVWHKDDEMTPELIEALKSLDVTCHNISGHTKEEVGGWALKPMVILASGFKEVLYIDADVVCVTDPEALFDLPEYREHGAIFWPDYWETEPTNPIWEITGVVPVKMKEQESGIILIDKARCWREIHLATYFNIHSYIYYLILLGDKDTFRFAWMALGTPFYFIGTDVSACGYVDGGGSFIGHTMIQHLPDGSGAFLHRNLLKWHVLRDYYEKWQAVKRFKPNAKHTEYHLAYHSVNKHTFVDLGGDAELFDFEKEYGDIEVVCLRYLHELRQTNWYMAAFPNELNQLGSVMPFELVKCGYAK